MIFTVKLGKSWKSFLLGFIKQINLFKLRNSQSRKYLELGGAEGKTTKCAYPVLTFLGVHLLEWLEIEY